jgi:phosphoglycolate phosphatase-like HAD superfamily hydrolase
MVVKAVVFVLDETIADFNLDQMTMKAEVRSHLVKEGIPASVLLTNESMFDMLKKAEIFLKNSGKSDRSVAKTRKEVWSLAQQHEFEAAKTASLVPGISEVLEALKKMRLKLGLVTTKGEKTANYVLKRFGLSRFFNSVTPREKVKSVNPSYEHLESAIKALHVKPEEAMLITGDDQDISSGRELNVLVTGLATMSSSEKEFTAAGVNYLISSILEVPRLVDTINKSQRSERVKNRKTF